MSGMMVLIMLFTATSPVGASITMLFIVSLFTGVDFCFGLLNAEQVSCERCGRVFHFSS